MLKNAAGIRPACCIVFCICQGTGASGWRSFFLLWHRISSGVILFAGPVRRGVQAETIFDIQMYLMIGGVEDSRDTLVLL